MRFWKLSPAGPKFSQFSAYPMRPELVQLACRGSMVADEPAACRSPSLGLADPGTAAADAPMLMVRVPGTPNTVYIRVGDRALGCHAYLTASADCANTTLILAQLAKGDARDQQQWVMRRVRDLPAKETYSQ
jgi:hypothetical protein